MNFKWFFEGIFVNLGRFDLSKVIFDVDEVLVRNYRDHELLIILKESVAHKGTSEFSLRCRLHHQFRYYIEMRKSFIIKAEIRIKTDR